jgi:tetratricopeptide (TPR) repeat protein
VNLRRLLFDLGREHEAEALTMKAVDIWQQSETPHDPRLGKAFLALGLIESKRNNRNLAVEHFTQALQLLSHASGSYPKEINEAKTALAHIQNEKNE